MASEAWLESSLRRSARLGLEVLERASRRSVDWSSSSNPSISQTPSEELQGDSTRTSLEDAFEIIAEFMAQTTYQCKNFYMSGTSSEPNETERTHVCRYHCLSHRRPGTSLQTRKHARLPPEDFHIEVSPGTYAITAGTADSQQQQTRLVRINAGESMNLTFDLSSLGPDQSS